MTHASYPKTSELTRSARIIFALLLLAPGAALADGGGSAPRMPSSSPAVPENRQASPEEQAAIAKKKAEDTYAAAYRDVEKAQLEMKEAGVLRALADEKSVKKAAQRDESATKRLKKSAERFEEVVAALPGYADAWNMLGYARRLTGDTQGAFDAYWKCLAIDPHHVGAHEYLGEAYLKAGKLDQAKGELTWLEKKGAKEAAILAASIAAWEKENPAVVTAPGEEVNGVTPPGPEKK